MHKILSPQVSDSNDTNNNNNIPNTYLQVAQERLSVCKP